MKNEKLTEEDVLNLFVDANTFYMTYIDPTEYWLDMDYENPFVQNGDVYYPVISGVYNSVEELKAAASRFFSENYQFEIVYVPWGDTFNEIIDSKFIDHNGRLYVLNHDGAGDYPPTTGFTIRIESQTETECVFVITEQNRGFNEGDALRTQEVRYKLNKNDAGRWVFTTYSPEMQYITRDDNGNLRAPYGIISAES